MTIDTKYAHTIVKIVKNEEGQLKSYELDNGERLSISDAVEYAKQGVIKDVEIAKMDNGEEYLKCGTAGNGDENNLPITETKSDKVDLKQYFQ